MTPAEALLTLLRDHEPLTENAAAELAAICGPVKTYRSGACIRPAGDTAGILLVMAGWMSEERSLTDGRQQIVRLHLPGDLIGHCGARTRARSDMVALTDVQVADISGLRGLVAGAQSSAYVSAAWCGLAEAGEEAALRHVVRLGRMTALERMSHVLLELYERLARVDLVQGRSMPMPLTQEQLADYLGLSVVHVNRTLQQLRRGGLVETQHRSVTLLDIRKLANLCGYPLTPSRPQSGSAKKVPV